MVDKDGTDPGLVARITEMLDMRRKEEEMHKLVSMIVENVELEEFRELMYREYPECMI